MYNRFSCFAVHSKMSQSTNAKSKPLEGLYTDTDRDDRSEIITDVTIRLPSKAGTMMMEVKVDPGAQPSCIPLHQFKTLFPHLCRDGLPKEGLLDNTQNEFQSYNGGEMTCYGYLLIDVKEKVTKKYHPIRFYVMNTDVPRILISHAASYWLGLVKVLCDNRAPRIKRQVASIDKKSDFRVKSSHFRTSTPNVASSSQKKQMTPKTVSSGKVHVPSPRTRSFEDAKIQGISDLREPQPSSSDSQPASSQPVSETTTSESSVSLPSSPSGSSSTESTSTSGTNSSSSETSSESSSQRSSNASSPETSSSASTSRSTSPELLEMECSFNSLLVGTRDHQSHPMMRSQMDNLRDQQQRIAILKQVANQPQNQPRPISAPPVANMPLPPYPQRCPSDKGSKNQVQAENANAPSKSSDSETDRLQDFQEEPRRCIGPSRVKELAKFFMPTSDEEENSRVNNRTRCKKLFEPKKEEESEK